MLSCVQVSIYVSLDDWCYFDCSCVKYCCLFYCWMVGVRVCYVEDLFQIVVVFMLFFVIYSSSDRYFLMDIVDIVYIEIYIDFCLY